MALLYRALVFALVVAGCASALYATYLPGDDQFGELGVASFLLAWFIHWITWTTED